MVSIRFNRFLNVPRRRGSRDSLSSILENWHTAGRYIDALFIKAKLGNSLWKCYNERSTYICPHS